MVVDPEPVPLNPGTTYAVLVRDGITDRYGLPLAPMAVGQLLKLDDTLATDGKSTIGSVPDADATRVERVRAEVDGLLDSVGRTGVVTAWPFTTLDRIQVLRTPSRSPRPSATTRAPTVTDRGNANQLFGADPLSDLFPGLLNPADLAYLPRVDGVAEVIEGTIPSPVHLDPVTRRWREPGVMQDISFVATVPKNVPANEPLPVVIFGHAVVTDRRFVLTMAGALSKRGFVAIAVDFPYHGDRIACIDTSLVAVPNFFPTALQPLVGLTDPLLRAAPCVSGEDASCSPTGQCLDRNGHVEPFASFPIIDIDRPRVPRSSTSTTCRTSRTTSARRWSTSGRSGTRSRPRTGRPRSTTRSGPTRSCSPASRSARSSAASTSPRIRRSPARCSTSRAGTWSTCSATASSSARRWTST